MTKKVWAQCVPVGGFCQLAKMGSGQAHGLLVNDKTLVWGKSMGGCGWLDCLLAS